MKACKQCLGPLNRSGGGSLFCFPCASERAKVRIAPIGRIRRGDFWRRRVNGEIVCVTCAGPIRNHNWSERKTVGCRHCDECGAAHRYAMHVLSGRHRAAAEVYRAKQAGTLPPIHTQHCADCGAEAQAYDHRDYNAPLAVQAVCRSCNVMRGSGVPFIPAPLFDFTPTRESERRQSKASERPKRGRGEC